MVKNMKNDKIKVIIVDDAAFMRKAVADILQSDSNVEVIETAKDGLDGLEKIKKHDPDVITLDIDMPKMDGLTAIRHIMIESPVPIVVLSSLSHDGAITFEALRLGVVDFVPKPSGAISKDIDQSRSRIVDRVKMASSVNMTNIRRVRFTNESMSSGSKGVSRSDSLKYLLGIGTTLSGPNTIVRLVNHLSPDLPAAIVIVQEISPKILPSFVERFNEHVPWKIAVAENEKEIEPGVCYIASYERPAVIGLNEFGNACLKLETDSQTPLSGLFNSAANIFHQNAIGVLLSGIGEDGADGLSRIKGYQGITMAQTIDTCVYPNLSDYAIQKGAVDVILDETDLPSAIQSVMT
jgi:two-component system chemotaxis response regulator CheB